MLPNAGQYPGVIQTKYQLCALVPATLLVLSTHLDTRIARGVVREHRPRSGEPVRVFIEHDGALVLDELALPEHAVHLRPPSGPALQLDALLRKARAERGGRLPRVVVRDLARDVVQDVHLGHAVRRERAEPCREETEVAEQVAVDGGQRAALEGEL